MVGPTRVSPKKSARIGALARANSSASTTPCIVDRPLPPYSSGQVAQIQPPSKSFWVHVLVEGRLLLGGHLEALVEPAVGQVLLEPGPDLDAELLGFGGVVRSMPPILTDRSSDGQSAVGGSVAPSAGRTGRFLRMSPSPRLLEETRRSTRWTTQWKELNDEVIDTGLCTGCAGCVISCPHDVIGYDHEAGRLQAVPPRGRARPRRLHPRPEGLHHAAPGPAPASASGSPRPTSTSSTATREPDEVAGIYQRHPADPGRRRHGPPDGPGRRARVGDPDLGDGARLHRRRPRVVPRGRRQRIWKADPRRGHHHGGGPRRRPAAATRTRPTRWRSTRRSRPGTPGSPWSA